MITDRVIPTGRRFFGHSVAKVMIFTLTPHTHTHTPDSNTACHWHQRRHQRRSQMGTSKPYDVNKWESVSTIWHHILRSELLSYFIVYNVYDSHNKYMGNSIVSDGTFGHLSSISA